MTLNTFAKFNLCKIRLLAGLHSAGVILAACGHHGDWHCKRQPWGSWEILADPALLSATLALQRRPCCVARKVKFSAGR